MDQVRFRHPIPWSTSQLFARFVAAAEGHQHHEATVRSESLAITLCLRNQRRSKFEKYYRRDMQGLTVGSLIAASRVAIENLLSFYTGNQPGGTPGIFDIANWYWWMGGAAWNVTPERPFPT